MATPQKPAPALLFAAVFSRHESALDWARERIEGNWGPVVMASERFEHSETQYYTAEMGEGLRKLFLVVDGWLDPARLPDLKLQTNTWEQELADIGGYPETRPLNIDPGYLTLSKIVLASAKDRAHRIYLRDGIYGEECLYYLGGWQSRPWTYPDYQRPDFQHFFDEVRTLLKRTM